VDFSNRKLGTDEGYQGCSERVLVSDRGNPLVWDGGCQVIIRKA